MSTLAEMSEQLIAIDNLLDDYVDPDDTNTILSEAKEKLLNNINIKISDILSYISACKGKCDYYKSEQNRLADKCRVLNNRVDWLKSLVFEHLKSRGFVGGDKQKYESGTYTLSLAKTPARVVLTDLADKYLPNELYNVVKTPNKTAIKDCMVDGKFVATVDNQEVELAYLEQGETLRIK